MGSSVLPTCSMDRLPTTTSSMHPSTTHLNPIVFMYLRNVFDKRSPHSPSYTRCQLVLRLCSVRHRLDARKHPGRGTTSTNVLTSEPARTEGQINAPIPDPWYPNVTGNPSPVKWERQINAQSPTQSQSPQLNAGRQGNQDIVCLCGFLTFRPSDFI